MRKRTKQIQERYKIVISDLYEEHEKQLTSSRQADILINELKQYMCDFKKQDIQIDIDFKGIEYLSKHFICLVFGVTEIQYPNIHLNCINNYIIKEKIDAEIKKLRELKGV